MIGSVALFERELSARRALWLVAVATAGIAALSPLLPGVGGYDRADIVSVASEALALVVGWGLAIGLGATTFGNELSAGRLGFFFARPIGSAPMWWGRLLAALALVVGSEVVVLVPAAVLGNLVPDLLGGGLVPGLLGYLVAPALLLLVSHAVSVALRARTPWLVLDIVGLVLSSFAAWTILAPFLALTGGMQALAVLAGAAVAGLFIALFLGGWIGLAIGRTDLRRTHGAMSLSLWATLGLMLAAIGAFGGWLRDFGPSEFDRVDVLSGSPDGRWIEVYGGADWRLDVRRRCLLSTVDGRWLAVTDAPLDFLDQVVYSLDGTTAVWTAGAIGDSSRALWWADLEAVPPTATETTITVPFTAPIFLSPTGSRVAVLDDGTLSVYGLVDERTVTAIRLSEDLRDAALIFTTENRARLFARSGGDEAPVIRIAEIDLESGRVARTGAVERLTGAPWVVVDPALERMIVWSRASAGERPTKGLYDAVSGAFLGQLSGSGFPRFIGDGRIVSVETDDDRRTRLLVETVGGSQPAVHELGDASPLLGGEPVPGWIALYELIDSADRTRGYRAFLLHLTTGERRELAAPVRRGLGWFPWHVSHGAPITWCRRGPGLSQLHFDQRGALHRWDPDSGRLVHVVGPTVD